VPEQNSDGYSVDWSVPAGMNRSTRLLGISGQRAAQPGVEGPAVMEASLVEVNGQVAVVVCGEVDLATAGALWEALQRAAVPSSTLVVDLSGTSFMDSSGLDVLLRARRHLATIGSTILLRSPHERILKLLEVSGLDRVLPVELERGLSGPDNRERVRPG
jgi:anti-sigma B factor antagonist